MKILKPKFWSKVNLISLILFPFSLITLIIYFLKRIIIQGENFKIPIVCVGNIYVGGTGKTPLSIYVFNLLKKNNYNPVLVRKYYRSQADEIDLTKSKIKKLITHKKRISAIIKAKRSKHDVIVMDDGLQDVSIKKKLNIVCFNSLDLAGNGFLLPAGPLREPLLSLNREDIVVINGKRNIAFERKIKKQSKRIKVFYSNYEIESFKKLKKKKLLAFAGIGNPDSFFEILSRNKFIVDTKVSFPDHYKYKIDELNNLKEIAKKKGLSLVTTEKDFFRIKKLGIKNIYYISVTLKISNSKKFEKELLKKI